MNRAIRTVSKYTPSSATRRLFYANSQVRSKIPEQVQPETGDNINARFARVQSTIEEHLKNSKDLNEFMTVLISRTSAENRRANNISVCMLLIFVAYIILQFLHFKIEVVTTEETVRTARKEVEDK